MIVLYLMKRRWNCRDNVVAVVVVIVGVINSIVISVATIVSNVRADLAWSVRIGAGNRIQRLLLVLPLRRLVNYNCRK